jgi:hypothetical protein
VPVISDQNGDVAVPQVVEPRCLRKPGGAYGWAPRAVVEVAAAQRLAVRAAEHQLGCGPVELPGEAVDERPGQRDDAAGTAVLRLAEAELTVEVDQRAVDLQPIVEKVKATAHAIGLDTAADLRFWSGE